jgi:glycosyltransferase involved in cell wall biosynthesis
MIYFLIPVFNEELNIPNLHRELNSLKLKDQVLYVFSDDGSDDRTTEVIQENFKNASYKILGDGVNRGPGVAFNFGFNWILSQSPDDNDVVVTIEADCTSDLSILNTMLVLNGLGYDLVLASVYAQGGGFDKTSFFRKLISSLANFLYIFLFDIKILTLSSFYRVYKVSLLRTIQKSYKGNIITEPGFVSMLEILAKSIWCKAKVIEVPMQLQSLKRVGRSKMKVVLTTLHYFRYLFRTKFLSRN